MRLHPGQADPGSAKPTWTVSFTRGDLTAYKTQLAPGDNAIFGSSNHVLIPITDVRLQQSSQKTSEEDIELKAQEVRMLPSGSEFKLTNSSSQSATFILIEF